MDDNKIIIYNTPDGETTVSVNLDGDTVWLSQQQMAVLFDKDRTVITRHINNIYKTKELEKSSTCAFLHRFAMKAAGPLSVKYRYTTLT